MKLLLYLQTVLIWECLVTGQVLEVLEFLPMFSCDNHRISSAPAAATLLPLTAVSANSRARLNDLETSSIVSRMSQSSMGVIDEKGLVMNLSEETNDSKEYGPEQDVPCKGF